MCKPKSSSEGATPPVWNANPLVLHWGSDAATLRVLLKWGKAGKRVFQNHSQLCMHSQPVPQMPAGQSSSSAAAQSQH